MEESPRRRAEAAKPVLLPLEASSFLPTQRAGLPCSGRSFAEERKSEGSVLWWEKEWGPSGAAVLDPCPLKFKGGSRSRGGGGGALDGGGSMGKVRLEEPVL